MHWDRLCAEALVMSNHVGSQLLEPSVCVCVCSHSIHLFSCAPEQTLICCNTFFSVYFTFFFCQNFTPISFLLSGCKCSSSPLWQNKRLRKSIGFASPFMWGREIDLFLSTNSCYCFTCLCVACESCSSGKAFLKFNKWRHNNVFVCTRSPVLRQYHDDCGNVCRGDSYRAAVSSPRPSRWQDAQVGKWDKQKVVGVTIINFRLID